MQPISFSHWLHLNRFIRKCAGSARRFCLGLKHRLLYRRFRGDTMIPGGEFRQNLQLAESLSRVPGCVVECGVWRGGMMGALSNVLGRGRHYYLFDSYEGLPPAVPIDGSAAMDWQLDTASPAYYDNCRASEAEARDTMRRAGSPPCTFVKGWFQDTLPGFCFEEPIALLRLDGDWYESILTSLETCFDQVADHGIIIIDDYLVWDGCARAVHDFLSRRQLAERLRVFGRVYYIQKIAAS